MARINISVKGLQSALSVSLVPGGALLVGREPDESRIDWGALATCPAISDPVNYNTYQVESLAVPAGVVSANHLLVLADHAATAVYDLGSRNGSWAQVEPLQPIVFGEGQDFSITLAHTPDAESPLHRPQDVEWSQNEDFARAVEQELTRWLHESELPVRVTLHPPHSRAEGFLLVDDSLIELQVQGTLEVPTGTLMSIISEYIHGQNERFQQLSRRASEMVAASPEIRQILLRTATSAATGRRTLFLGPTGVGKELLARSYHGYSPRRDGPFVTVNCALLEKDLLYAQLFGARRGSFTSAVSDVPGLIEAAHGGTLFLDELGEMSPEVQKALLRFLDSRGEYYRLGDPKARRADVQIVGASNAPLDDPDYRSQRFRDDLWYRLAASVVLVPPLCERPEDVRAYLSSRKLHGGKLSVAEALSAEALADVMRDPWPGNFRDLENFIDRLPAVMRPGIIDRATCAAAIQEGRPRTFAGRSAAARGPERASTAAPPAAPSAVPDAAGRSSGKARAVTVLPKNAALGWEHITQSALSAFLQDQGEALAGWDQLQLLVERYLKPMYVAYAALPQHSWDSLLQVNYSAIARRLCIGDGSTVKTHLVRFEERFVRHNAPDSSKQPAATLASTSD